MTAQLDVLTKKLRSVEAQIEVELAKHAKELRFRIENRKIVFEQDVKRIHRAIKVRASRYFIDQSADRAIGAGDLFADCSGGAGRYLGDGLSGDLLSDVQDSEGAPPRLSGVRPPPSGVSQRHREDQLRLLLLLQRRDCVRARGGVAHRGLLVPNKARPPHPRSAPALSGLCRFR
jgi:hypothetical protein